MCFQQYISHQYLPIVIAITDIIYFVILSSGWGGWIKKQNFKFGPKLGQGAVRGPNWVNGFKGNPLIWAIEGPTSEVGQGGVGQVSAMDPNLKKPYKLVKFYFF